jgi:hypothetical protein
MKTIQEQIEEKIKSDYPNDYEACAFTEGVNFTLELANKWYDVKECLPDYEVTVLVKYISIDNEILSCCAQLQKISRHNRADTPHNDEWFVFPSLGRKVTVTHWKHIELK